MLLVEVDTHICATLEFACDAIVTLTCSFDVWDSENPRLELYGTKGTVLIDEMYPIFDHNLFDGDTLLHTPEQYRWIDPARKPDHVNTPWTVISNRRLFNSVSHAENPCSIDMVDLVYALREGYAHRVSGDMAPHSLEVMECIRSAPLPSDFSANQLPDF